MIYVYIAIGVVVLFALLFVASYVKTPTNEAYIITGLRKEPRILIGKAGLRIPFFEKINRVNLGLISVDIKTRSAIPTREFININVDAVANIKISSKPELLRRAAESLLGLSEKEIIEKVIQVLEGNIREIVGASCIRDMVQDRKGIAEKVIANVVPDMEKIGIEVINFNIQNFTDDSNVIVNLGIDNIAQISKDAAIAKANADRDVAVASAAARKEANDAKVESDMAIIQRETEYALKAAQLKEQSETARATADAAYEIQKQKRQEEVNVVTINAEIAQRERQTSLAEKEIAIKERKLDAEVKKTADAEKYAVETKATADLFTRQKEAEARKYELEKEAEMRKIEADAAKYTAEQEAAARVAKADAEKEAAIAEATGIEAKGKAEAEAILKKADAMKQYGEAATLQLILDSGVLPEVVRAYSEPMAAALKNIGSITMYGEGNQTKLVEEIGKNGSQIVDGLEKTLGVDVKALLAGFLGGKLATPKTPTEVKVEEVKEDK